MNLPLHSHQPQQLRRRSRSPVTAALLCVFLMFCASALRERQRYTLCQRSNDTLPLSLVSVYLLLCCLHTLNKARIFVSYIGVLLCCSASCMRVSAIKVAARVAVFHCWDFLSEKGFRGF